MLPWSRIHRGEIKEPQGWGSPSTTACLHPPLPWERCDFHMGLCRPIRRVLALIVSSLCVQDARECEKEVECVSALVGIPPWGLHPPIPGKRRPSVLRLAKPRETVNGSAPTFVDLVPTMAGEVVCGLGGPRRFSA